MCMFIYLIFVCYLGATVGDCTELIINRSIGHPLQRAICQRAPTTDMSDSEGNEPRGRASSYAYFVQKTIEDFKREHPNEDIVFSELSKRCSETWNKMSDKEKEKYVKMADEDSKR